MAGLQQSNSYKTNLGMGSSFPNTNRMNNIHILDLKATGKGYNFTDRQEEAGNPSNIPGWKMHNQLGPNSATLQQRNQQEFGKYQSLQTHPSRGYNFSDRRNMGGYSTSN